MQSTLHTVYTLRQVLTEMKIYSIARQVILTGLFSKTTTFAIIFSLSRIILISVIALVAAGTLYESILLSKGYDLIERRRSSRVDKSDIDQVKNAFSYDGKNMEMYKISQDNNNISVNGLKESPTSVAKSTRGLNILTRFLICFGLKQNISVIMNVDKTPKDSLNFVHGLRLFSLLWTILVHTYLQLFAVGENRVRLNDNIDF